MARAPCLLPGAGPQAQREAWLGQVARKAGTARETPSLGEEEGKQSTAIWEFLLCTRGASLVPRNWRCSWEHPHYVLVMRAWGGRLVWPHPGGLCMAVGRVWAEGAAGRQVRETWSLFETWLRRVSPESLG